MFYQDKLAPKHAGRGLRFPAPNLPQINQDEARQEAYLQFLIKHQESNVHIITSNIYLLILRWVRVTNSKAIKICEKHNLQDILKQQYIHMLILISKNFPFCLALSRSFSSFLDEHIQGICCSRQILCAFLILLQQIEDSTERSGHL